MRGLARLWLLAFCCGVARAVENCEVLQGRVESSLLGSNQSWADAITAVAKGASMGCGRCFFYLGALLALSEPEVSRFAHFKVSAEGGIQFQWTEGLSEPVTSTETEILDRPLLAYYIGAEKRDALSTLALSNYMLNLGGQVSPKIWGGGGGAYTLTILLYFPTISPFKDFKVRVLGFFWVPLVLKEGHDTGWH